MPTFEILCATMHQKDFSKVKEMNIKSDVVFANQCDHTAYEEYEFDGHKAKMISTTTRGVGKNRNLTLMYSEADICLFADDDLCYVADYVDIIQTAFSKKPDADAIIFNLITKNRPNRRVNDKLKRVRWYNALNYGTVRVAVKRNSIKREGISFNTCFGGGTEFSAGEDSLFICSMLKSGLKIYTYPVAIASINDTVSTWFKGFNEKFFYDKGVLYSAISKFWAKPLCLQDLIRHKQYKKNGFSLFEAYSLMKQGIKGRKTLRTYADYEQKTTNEEQK